MEKPSKRVILILGEMTMINIQLSKCLGNKYYFMPKPDNHATINLTKH